MNFNYRLYRTWVRLKYRVNKKPVFILGNQKTGTSAISALLGEATSSSYTVDVFCHLGDLQQKLVEREITFSQFIKFSKDYFSKKIIKEPSFTFFFPELAKHFPEAKFILIIRNPFDNVRSICNRLNVNGNFEGTVDQIGELTFDWELVGDGKYYGHDGVNFIETLAKRANACYKLFVNNQNRIHLFRYEDFVQEKKAEIERLAGLVGLGVTKDISELVDQQFQPKGFDISPKEFFNKRNYDLISNACNQLIKDQYA